MVMGKSSIVIDSIADAPLQHQHHRIEKVQEKLLDATIG
jgi:hypothetical protein